MSLRSKFHRLLTRGLTGPDVARTTRRLGCFRSRLLVEALEDRSLPTSVSWSSYLVIDASNSRQGVGGHSYQAVALDAVGNSYITGATSNGNGQSSAFIQKRTPTGSAAWATSLALQ